MVKHYPEGCLLYQPFHLLTGFETFWNKDGEVGGRQDYRTWTVFQATNEVTKESVLYTRIFVKGKLENHHLTSFNWNHALGHNSAWTLRLLGGSLVGGGNGGHIPGPAHRSQPCLMWSPRTPAPLTPACAFPCNAGGWAEHHPQSTPANMVSRSLTCYI